MFKTAKPRLFVGGVEADKLGEMISKIKEAKAANKGVTFFLWRNEQQGPPFALSIDVERERSERRPAAARKPIEPDDDFGDGETGGDDSLFGDD